MMLTVQDVMTRGVVSVHPDLPLREVARLLVEHGISGLPVVDPDDRVIGVISEGDLLIKETGPDAVGHRPLARLFGESRESASNLTKVDALTAGEAMTSPPITIDPRASLHAAAALMVDRKVNRLPVTHEGTLVGILTRADLVRAFVRTDEQLAESIREDVLLRAMSLNPTVFDVRVTDGVVHIAGHVDRESEAEAIERLARMVPGVVRVESELAWNPDAERDITIIDHFIPSGR